MNGINKPLTLLFISHVNPILRSAGNEIRIYKMIKWLRAEGAKVVLLLNHPPLSSEIRLQLLGLVDAVYTPDQFRLSIFRRIITKIYYKIMKPLFFRQLSPKTDAEKVRAYFCPSDLIKASGVLCKRYNVQAIVAEYVFTTPCLRNVSSNVLKLVDTHDLLSKRNPKEAIYCSAEEERAYLLNADVVIAIQADEAKQFRNLVPEREVVTVGIDYEVAASNLVDESYKNTVLVVGSNYPANISGIKAFCEHAWPLVCKKKPKAVLMVAGKIGDAISTDIPQVRVLGWVDDLQTLYRQSAVVINPTMSGTGIKVKTVEALCNGKPLVATPNAVEGLDFKGEAPCLVCYNWQEFAEAIVSLLESDERCMANQEAAIRFAEEKFAGRKVYAELAAILQSKIQ